MATTLAFDVYGTLINTHGVVSLLENMVGDNAQAIKESKGSNLDFRHQIY